MSRSRMLSTVDMSQLERDQLAESCNSVFLNKDSLHCALLAAGRQTLFPFSLFICLTFELLRQGLLGVRGGYRIQEGGGATAGLPPPPRSNRGKAPGGGGPGQSVNQRNSNDVLFRHILNLGN